MLPSVPNSPFCKVIVATALLLATSSASRSQEKQATPPERLVVPEGFEVQLLRSAGEGEDSWISLTFDSQGRVIVALDTVGLARIAINPDKTTTFEKIEDSLKHCRGVLFAHDALYVNATNSNGFYRLRDTNGDDRFDETRLLKKFDYRSRYGHGQNQMKLGPDGMLYLVIGNDCAFPDGTAPDSPYQNPQPDQLLPNPHDAGEDKRVGYIVRTDRDGKRWEVIAGGLRNQVDVAFNPAGELFTWDADMEWDVGMPWYRPNRINHIVSGGEYGWRWGSGKWPAWRADALPSNLDTGLGSPTSLEFGTGSEFPQSYREKLFMADWQNGRILMADPQAEGASYRFDYQAFIEGSPLNVSDLVFGPDGAMYFITGGRGSQSGLYRVSYTGPKQTEVQPEVEDLASQQARELRHQLERFHTRQDPAAIELAFRHLESTDPWIRFAARLALERQPPATWRERALAGNSIHALMALTRAGDKTDLEPLLGAISRIPLEMLSREDLLAALRTLQLAFIRLGSPDNPNTALSSQLLALYPSASSAVNRELLELLVFLQSGAVLEPALHQLETAPTQEEQIFIAMTLLHLKDGWDVEKHRRTLRWLVSAKRYRGGRLLDTVLKNLRVDYLAKLSESDRAGLAELLAKVEDDTPGPVIVEAPGAFVRSWKSADFTKAELEAGNRDLNSGRQAAAASMCLVCHQVGEEGGQIGPDLSQVSGRFDTQTLLESIIEPSKVIAPKYRSVTYSLNDGTSVSGIAAGVSGSKLRIEVNSLTREVVEIERDAIQSAEPAEISAMPPGLVNTLTREQILDLLAYLKNGGISEP